MSVTVQTHQKPRQPARTNGAVTFSERVAARRLSRRSLTSGEIDLLGRYREELGGRVLEIGATGDSFTSWLAINADSYTGIAASRGVVERCEHRLPFAGFRDLDSADLYEFPDGHFDAIVLDTVGQGRDLYGPLSHRDVTRVLVPGGLMIIRPRDGQMLSSKTLGAAEETLVRFNVERRSEARAA